jgi:hypothetical protein
MPLPEGEGFGSGGRLIIIFQGPFEPEAPKRPEFSQAVFDLQQRSEIIARAAANRSEKVSVLVGVGRHDAPVRQRHLRRPSPSRSSYRTAGR